jgi:hypothetical protein
MSKLVRFAVAIAVGLLVWIVVATLGNFVLRVAIPGYRAEEAAVSFSLIAQLGRLALSVVSTAAAAAATVVMSRGSIGASLAVGCILLALFVPVHVSLWHRFPVWYHLFFLASLPIGTYVFGKLVASRRGAA